MFRPPFRRRRGHAVLTAMLHGSVCSAAAFGAGAALAQASAQAPASAPAERAQNDVLATITITAEKRETDVQKTAISVGVAPARELDEKANRGITALAGEVASIRFPDAQPAAVNIFVRGIGISRTIGSPSVGLYLDDVYLARAFGVGFFGSFPDLDRVEVLRGPQGTLYGQSNSAGAVKLISLDPSDEFHAWTEARIGNLGARELRAFANAAIVPGVLAGSIAFAHREDDGDVYNARQQRQTSELYNDQLRLKFKLTPAEGFSAVLAIDYLRDRTSSRNSSPVAFNGTPFPDSAERVTFSEVDPERTHDNGGVSLKLSADIGGGLTLRSITAARGFHADMPVDSIPIGGYRSGFLQILSQRQLSQEFQLLGEHGPWDFNAGLTFFKERFEVDRLNWANSVFSLTDSVTDRQNAGIYGQLGYRLSERLKLVAGLRASRETQQLDSAGYTSNLQRERLSETYRVTGLERSWNGVTPKLGIDFQWTPQVFTYASLSRGETAGGYNPIAATAPIASVPTDPEKVTTWEFGLKTTGWGGRLRTSAAVFYSDYRDYLASITNPVVGGVPITGGVILNAGSAKLHGLEFETSLRPTQALQLGLTFAYLKSEFGDFVVGTAASPVNLRGQALPHAPEFTASLRAAYTVPAGGLGALKFSGSVRWETDSFTGVAANRGDSRAPEQTVVDAALVLTSPSGLWTTTLSVANLLDKTYAFTANQGVYQGLFYNRSRQVFLGVRRDFL